MSRSLRLRPWQRQALDRLAASPGPDFLAVATPGAGKTTFALAAALTHLAAHPDRRVVVVAPTAHLKLQWARAAAVLGLELAADWTGRDGVPPADLHGAVLTYQQVAAGPAAVRGLARGAFVVLDEVHHAADDRAWGDALRVAFTGAARRLAVSGTPFRSDTTAIPFVRYDDHEAVPDFEYGYGDALADRGVVRPVYFPRVDGEMEWTAPDGTRRHATFGDHVDRAEVGHRLRTALSLDGEWLPEVLRRAHERLRAVRAQQPDAGGLVIAADQEHARGIAALLRERHGVRAAVATSDDPLASGRITTFAAGDAEWIVAVRMVSEGVDVPRLRVGVYATTTTTELFFRQAVGRLVRWVRGAGRQPAYLYVPDDARLRTWAAGIAEQRRHCLKRRDDEAEEPALPVEREPAREEQPSLFAALSSVAIGDPDGGLDDAAADGPGSDRAGSAESRSGVDATLGAEASDLDPPEDAGDVLILTAPARGRPPRGNGNSPGAGEPGTPPAGADGPGGAVTRGEQRRALRDANAARARAIATRTGRTHAQVNAELNKLAGLRSIREATVAQLERRLRHADRLLTRC